MSESQRTSRHTLALLATATTATSVGDEAFRVALAWTSVELLGEAGGLITALQVGALLFGALFGGVWSDGRSARGLLRFALSMRMLLVLALGIAALSGWLSLALLLAIVLAVSVLGSLVEPSIQASVAIQMKTLAAMQRANAAIEFGRRLARAGGPSAAAFIAMIFGTPALYLLAAFGHGVAALIVGRIPAEPPRAEDPVPEPRRGALAGALHGFRLLRGRPFEIHLFVSRGVYSVAWFIGLIVGTALRLKQAGSDDAGDFGIVMATYGVGALAVVALTPLLSPRLPNLTMSLGRLAAGSGFVLMGLAEGREWILAGAAIAAIGGPLEKIGMATVLQSRSQPDLIQALVRAMIAIEMSIALAALLASPLLFRAFDAGHVVAGVGFATALTGLWGFACFDRAGQPRRRTGQA